MEGQDLSALRARRGRNWSLFEFWKDEVKEHREIVDKFIDPILEEAITRKKISEKSGAEMKEGDNEDDTLLAHLFRSTDGLCCYLIDIMVCMSNHRFL